MSWEQQLEVEVAGLTRALGEAAVEIRVWKKERGGSSGSFQGLEVVRVVAGMSIAGFCRLIGMPERAWRRWQAKARRAEPSMGRWPQPARQAARSLVTTHALAKPEWGHRKIWAMTRHDWHKLSQATVLRLLRDDHLILPSELRQAASKAHQRPQSCIHETPTGPVPGVAAGSCSRSRPPRVGFGGSRGAGTGTHHTSTLGISRRLRTSMTRSRRSSSSWPTMSACSGIRSSIPAPSTRAPVCCYPWS